MQAARTVLLTACLLATGSVVSAATITSTPAGGPWAQSSTWVGGVVPGSGDDVVLVGPVEVTVTETCRSLDIKSTGSLTGALSGPSSTLQVAGPVSNAGTIADGLLDFFLEVGGDLHNDGS